MLPFVRAIRASRMSRICFKAKLQTLAYTEFDVTKYIFRLVRIV
jgi:hypothetical protein